MDLPTRDCCILWLHRSVDEQRLVIAAVQRACGDDLDCAVDGVVYAIHESNMQNNPKAWSWDAKGGKSCGVWQMPCALVRTMPSINAQARAWVQMRAASLDAYGSLLGLAGNTPAGEALTRARELETADAVFAATWAE